MPDFFADFDVKTFDVDELIHLKLYPTHKGLAIDSLADPVLHF